MHVGGAWTNIAAANMSTNISSVGKRVQPKVYQRGQLEAAVVVAKHGHIITSSCHLRNDSSLYYCNFKGSILFPFSFYIPRVPNHGCHSQEYHQG